MSVAKKKPQLLTVSMQQQHALQAALDAMGELSDRAKTRWMSYLLDALGVDTLEKLDRFVDDVRRFRQVTMM